MFFRKKLIPDLVLRHYYDLTPDTVKSFGGSVILSDIDNTLVTYDDEKPTAAVLEWIEKMREAGVTVAFVSNNNKDRVDKFNEEIGLVAFSDAGKPKTKYLRAALDALGKSKSDAVLLGDQLLTDCAAAKYFGIPAIIVPPIKDKKTLFFRMKRLIEVPYMKQYYKSHKE